MFGTIVYNFNKRPTQTHTQHFDSVEELHRIIQALLRAPDILGFNVEINR